MKENQPSGHTYIMDPESPTEMARLMLQDRLFTEGMQGVFSERSDLDDIQTILDVGCGPGGWALDVAHIYPDRRVVGIDISTTMITYAQAQATAQRLTNVTFSVMNALEPFKFAAGTFDLVNSRTAASFVVRTQWPSFLQNCLQVLRPGGILRVTEPELVGLTNSAACEKIISWASRILHTKGYGFSPDGSHYGNIPMLGLLLQEAGCVNLGFRPHMLDYSAGTAFHNSQYQNYMVWPLLLKPALIREGLTTEEEFDHTYNQMLEEMQMLSFRGFWNIFTAWGQKQV